MIKATRTSSAKPTAWDGGKNYATGNTTMEAEGNLCMFAPMKVLFTCLLLALCAATGLKAQPMNVNETPLITPEVKPEMTELIPSLAVADMAKAMDYYTRKLGFGVLLQNGNYMAVGRDLVQIGLVLDRGSAKMRKGSCYIQMGAVDVFYRELQTKGVRFTSELRTQPSKMREFSVTDPDGNMLVFGEYMGNKQ